MRATLSQSERPNTYTSGGIISQRIYRSILRAFSAIKQSAFGPSFPTSRTGIQRSNSVPGIYITGVTRFNVRRREAIPISNNSLCSSMNCYMLCITVLGGLGSWKMMIAGASWVALPVNLLSTLLPAMPPVFRPYVGIGMPFGSFESKRRNGNDSYTLLLLMQYTEQITSICLL